MMTRRMPRQISTVSWAVEGKAEVNWPTPAAMETATVNV